MLGVFREDQKTREEFLNLVNSKWELSTASRTTSVLVDALSQDPIFRQFTDIV